MTTKSILLWLATTSTLCVPPSAFAASRTQDLPQPTEIQGVPCQGRVEFYEDGRIHFCRLSSDCTIRGNALPANSELRFNEPGNGWWCKLARAAIFSGRTFPADCEICFHENGDIASCRPTRDSAVLGNVLPATSIIFFPRRESMRGSRDIGWGPASCLRCWLAEETLIQGHLCRATMDGVGHILYPSGRLCGICLAHDEEIDGVPCTSSFNPFRMPWHNGFFGTDFMAWFYENGHLQQGMVPRDITIQGHLFKAGSIVSLTPEGKIDLNAKTLGAESHGPINPYSKERKP